MTTYVPAPTDSSQHPLGWFAGLDGLRAIAAFLIVFHHAGFSSGLTFRSDLGGLLLTRMDIGVSIFFVLSGFLLYRPFVTAQFEGRPAPATGPFWIRRLVRIYPGYWVALVIQLALGVVTVLGFVGFLASFGLVHVYHPSRAISGLTQSWSLATELGFYLLLPWVAAAARRFSEGRSINRQAQRLLGVCVALALGSVVFRLLAAEVSPYPNNWWGNASRLWVTSYFDVFAAGMALAIVSAWADHRRLVRDYMANIARRVWLWYAGAVVLFWFVSTQLRLERGLFLASPRLELVRQTIYLLVGVALVLPIVFGPHDRSLILKTLSTRVLSYLGLVSYGIYLWHQAFLTWTHDLFGWGDFEGDFIVLVIVGSLGSIAAAAASHRLVEAPLTAMVKARLADRRSKADA